MYRWCALCCLSWIHHLLQVGEGSIAALSTGGAVSKFGFPLQVGVGRSVHAGLHCLAAHMACRQLLALHPILLHSLQLA